MVEAVSSLLLCCIVVIGDVMFYLFLIALFYIVSTLQFFARKNRTYTRLIHLYIFNLLHLKRAAVIVGLFLGQNSADLRENSSKGKFFVRKLPKHSQKLSGTINLYNLTWINYLRLLQGAKLSHNSSMWFAK